MKILKTPLTGSFLFAIICVTIITPINLEDLQMSDYYTEQLVKKRADMKDVFIKALLVALTIVSVLIVFMFPFGIILPVGMIVLDVFMFRRMNVEYEYLYVNGDLDIDKIMNKAKRKRVFSAHVSNLELLAPVKDLELRQHADAKTFDFSSRNDGARLYALVVVDRGQKKKVIFEPNDTIIEGFKMLAPRKVAQ